MHPPILEELNIEQHLHEKDSGAGNKFEFGAGSEFESGTARQSSMPVVRYAHAHEMLPLVDEEGHSGSLMNGSYDEIENHEHYDNANETRSEVDIEKMTDALLQPSIVDYNEEQHPPDPQVKPRSSSWRMKKRPQTSNCGAQGVGANSVRIVNVSAGAVTSTTTSRPHFMDDSPAIEHLRNSQEKKDQKQEQTTALVIKKTRSETRRDDFKEKRQRNTFHSVIFRDDDQKLSWAQNRLERVGVVLELLRNSDAGGSYAFGFLTEDMRNLAEILCKLALEQYLTVPNYNTIDTANPTFWAFAFAQEAWARYQPDKSFRITVRAGQDYAEAQHRMSWEGMEYIYDQVKGIKVLYSGKMRKVCSFNMGRAWPEMNMKMEHLNKLLIDAGDDGIRVEIRNMQKPEVFRYEAPDAFCANSITGRQQARIMNHPMFGKLKVPVTAPGPDDMDL